MSDTPAKPASFMERFKIAKMAMENVFSEREVFTSADKQKPGVIRGLWVILVIAAAQFLLLGMNILLNSSPFTSEDAKGVAAVSDYAAAFSSGDLLRLFEAPVADGALPRPHLYYITMVPAVKLFQGHEAGAIVLFNSFYILLLCLFVHLIVRYNRTDPCGWMAACYVSCLPFVLDLSRHISPDLAVVTWTAGAYAAFIWSSELENKWWSYLFALCFMAGMLSGWQFLAVVAPLFFFLPGAFFSHISRDNAVKVVFPAAALFGAWLVINMPALLVFAARTWPSISFSGGMSVMDNIMWYFWHGIDAMQIPFFVLGAASMLWMSVVSFMPFPKRDDLLKWLYMPYVVLVFFPKNIGYYAPAMVAMAPAVGIVTPSVARRYIAGAMLFMALLNQAGCPRGSMTYFGHTMAFWGTSRSLPSEKGLASAFDVLRRYSSGKTGLNAEVYAVDKSLDTDSLAWRAAKSGMESVTFRRYSGADWSYPQIIIAEESLQGGAARPVGGTDFTDVAPSHAVAVSTLPFPSRFGQRSDPLSILNRYYEKASSVTLRSGATADIYLFKEFHSAPLPSGTYPVRVLRFGDFYADNAEINLGDWNSTKGSYDKAVVSCSLLRYKGGAEIYGVRAELSGLRLILELDGAADSIAPVSVEGVRIAEAYTTDSNLQMLVDSIFNGPKDYSMTSVPGGLTFSTRIVGANVGGRIAVEQNNSGLSFAVRSVTVEKFMLPDGLLVPFRYAIDSKPGPRRSFSLSAAPIEFQDAAIRIKEPAKVN